MSVERTVNVTVKLSPKEKEIIERYAKSEKSTVAGCLRSAIFLDMALSGNKEAIAYALKYIGSHVFSKLKGAKVSLQWDGRIEEDE